jgi:glycosyltransferase involved in cell wall biosynthesis
MKISIVIPSSNEAEYVETLIDFIKSNSKPENIEEVIIVEAFNTNRIIKLAEKSHAKLYYNQLANSAIQMEIGAFEAKGEIIYFIKPGCVPPAGFDERIIKYVQEKHAMGCFDFDMLDSENIFIKFYKKVYSHLFKGAFQANSFFVLSKLYHHSGGLKKYRNYLNLKKEILLRENKS